MLKMSISEMINDIILHSAQMITQFNIKTDADFKQHDNFLISMSDKMQNDCLKIRSFLYENVYNHPKLIEKRTRVETIILKLFEYYEKNFDKLPTDWLSKSESEIKQRIICDYISGMTDRYASKLYNSIYE